MVGAGLGPLAMGMSYDRTSSYKLMLECFAVALAVASLPVLRLGTYAIPVRRKRAGGNAMTSAH
jgi:cyanate permease